MSEIFIDTNILVYAVDRDAGYRNQRAKEILRPFYSDNLVPAISAQVLHEFANRMFRWQMTDDEINTLIEPMRYWTVVANDLALFDAGLEVKKRYQTSFWDGLILAAATRVGAKEIWSEDFNSGQDYGGVIAVNPFLDS